MPVNLLASPRIAFAALEGFAAEEEAFGQRRAVLLKELSDHDVIKAPKNQHMMVCYVIDNVGVLVAYHVSETNSRTRPYLMLCHASR